MKTITIQIIFVICCVGFSYSKAQAAQSPKLTIQKSAEQIRKILRKTTKKGQKKELKKVVDSFLDYTELSRRSLGPHWEKQTSQEKAEFTNLLRELIEASYTSSISKNIEFQMEYEDEEISDNGSQATIMAVASAKNKKGKTVSEDLTFHMYLKDKTWMIFDIEFGDVSLVRHYRGEFNRKIKKESYKALLVAMRKKLKEIKSGKLQNKPKL